MTEAQVFSRQWAPPTGVLGRILGETAQRVAAIPAADRDAIERRASVVARAPSFIDAMRGSTVAVIAEVKRRSPSRGSIRESIAAELQGVAYERGGARAISVLTEPLHFGGSVTDLENTRARVGIPLLRKDFHIDEIQLYEARAAGASAVLLIVRALSPERLATMMESATRLQLEALVEVHTESELALAVELGARVIGVNSRDLETLEIDARVLERLLGVVPAGMIAIAESGIESRADVEVRALWGADAVLIGSALSASADPESAVRAMTGVPRSGRAN
ncbi:MAG TPA: indole-3-glycerol phosphate synthase TrpC [Gemmatimonadaceae bacterium]